MSDYIKREDAQAECNKRGVEHVAYAIGLLPCADVVERKRGEWIRTFDRNIDGKEWFMHCSVCKKSFLESEIYICGNYLPHFCPECGADMRGAK